MVYILKLVFACDDTQPWVIHLSGGPYQNRCGEEFDPECPHYLRCYGGTVQWCVTNTDSVLLGAVRDTSLPGHLQGIKGFMGQGRMF